MADGRISDAGKSAEQRFFALVARAERTDAASTGDAVVDGVPVEIKQASSTTLNQVRAVKYIPLVCLDTKNNRWFVVPAHQVVRIVSAKNRGQHTENPFESATISKSQLGDFIVPRDKDLERYVVNAIREANKFPQLRLEMERIREQASLLARESLTRVRGLLATMEID